ncbi:hypothetical protein RF11_06471 [Thelohanellus kitauei]|uniref:Uncharacterized protein n=1 Tax=Thelohanellus kitauei TaxID=669202 RepID=A0A0C2IWR4_THEKT|nr:hypothetical protein RF11_06471 [Thelohanellus kitauei]
MIAYFWLSGTKNKQIEVYTGHSKCTVTLQKISKTVSERLQRRLHRHNRENDETINGKNKHNQGHPVNGPWVLCCVERTGERQVFLAGVPDDPKTGANSNYIEGSWNALKYQIPPRNRTNSLDDDGKVIENVLNDHLGKFE